MAKKTVKQFVVMSVMVAICGFVAYGTSYYVDNVEGDNDNPGTWSLPWKTLGMAASQTYVAGDELCLKRGCTFWMNLELYNVDATAENPFILRAYGNWGDPDPIINSRGYKAGIHLRNSSGVIIKDIEIVSDRDNGTIYETSSTNQRYGVYVEMNDWRANDDYSDIILTNLYIHDILSSSAVESTHSKESTYHEGDGIRVDVGTGATLTNVVIAGCTIQNTGRYGIKLQGKKVGNDYTLRHVDILDSKMTQTGGSGLQGSNIFDWLVSGNTVTNSGWFKSVSVPTFGRGSGIWPWQCKNVRIMDNRFLSARGKGDSCGAHIDFNNIDVIVEYNFSYDNEGGFIEILGNCTNSIYRYNVSVNDGWRVKGVDGATQDGKVLWLSGYTGSGNTKTGPFYSYIYNNTVYVNTGTQAVFAVTPTADGVKIENNIFHIASGIATVNGSDDQDSTGVPPGAAVTNVVFRNNLYNRTLIPAELPIQDSDPSIANPQFPFPGVIWPYGYIPGNTDAVQDEGIRTWKLTGDPLYIWIDLQVDTDIMFNTVTNTAEDPPDMGAIELQP